MAKFSVFRNYGNQDNSQLEATVSVTLPKKEEVEVNLDSLAETVQKVAVVTKQEKTNPTPKNTKKQSGRGRPSIAEVETVSRTYKIAQPALEAMEDKFYMNRRNMTSGMSFSKYISNLIWQDTHNGEKLFDEQTGELLKK